MRLYDYAASGNCFKVRLLLALLGRDCERVPTDIFGGDTLTPEYARLNPAREVPVLVTDEGEVLVQSNAILWYLAEGTAFLPGDALGCARVVQWLHFEQEWIMAGIGGPRFVHLTGRPERPGRLELGRQALGMLDAALTERPFVAGEAVSIADLSLFAYTHVAGDVGLELSGWPGVEAWVRRVEALPGFVNDFAPYPPEARPGAGRSIYD